MKSPHGDPGAFFEIAMSSVTDECILWPYANSRGYPKMWVGPTKARRLMSVHRLACEREHGPQPIGMPDAAHRCGNRGCINRRHVRWTTSRENHADKIIHGRTNRGERHGHSKLTTQEVLRIKERLAVGERKKVIAADYGVVHGCISRIERGITWSWLSVEGGV